MSDPTNPTRVVDYNDCASAGGQGDVVVWGNILVRSWDSPVSAGQAATARCGGQLVITTPAANAEYAVGQVVTPVFTCTDNDGVESCTGSSATLDTATTGAHTFTVTAKDLAGNVTTKSVSYNVLHDDADGNVSGSVPGTLSLTLGAPANFGAFTAGVARDYSASTTANVVSSAGEATLSVTDPAATNAGHLVNGAFALPQALQARATNVANPSTVFANIGNTPLNLLTYGGPISNDPVSLQFKQTIASTDALRTGTYSKTLVFTLSTTSP